MSRKTKKCLHCSKNFVPYLKKEDGSWHNGYNRKFCYECSPFGTKDKRPVSQRILQPQDISKRVCYTCKIEKDFDLKNFAKGKYTLGLRSSCRKCDSQRVIKKQRLSKLKCLEYLGNKCSICGYNKCVSSLHFHHKDPSNKEFTIGKYRLRSWEDTTKELDKCIVLCANCHGEVHAGITTI